MSPAVTCYNVLFIERKMDKSIFWMVRTCFSLTSQGLSFAAGSHSHVYFIDMAEGDSLLGGRGMRVSGGGAEGWHGADETQQQQEPQQWSVGHTYRERHQNDTFFTFNQSDSRFPLETAGFKVIFPWKTLWIVMTKVWGWFLLNSGSQ